MNGLNFSWLVGLVLVCLFSNCATTPPPPTEKQVHSPDKISTQDLTVNSNELIEIQDIVETGKASSRMENGEGTEKQTREVVTGNDGINLEEDMKEHNVILPVAKRGQAENDSNKSTPLLLKKETLSSAEQLDQVVEKNTVENWQGTNVGIMESDGNISKNLEAKPDNNDWVVGATLPIETKKDSVEINPREGNGTNEEFFQVVNSDNNASKLESYFDPKRSLLVKNIDVNAPPLNESNTTSLRREKLSISPLQKGSNGKSNLVNRTGAGLKVDLVSGLKNVPVAKKNLDISLPVESDSVDKNEFNNKQKISFDSVQSKQVNEEAVKGNTKIGFQAQNEHGDFILQSTKLQVGLKDETLNPILRNQTINDREIIEPDNSPRKYGYIRTFLDRTKRIQEPREGGIHSQFDRAQKYLKRESNETISRGINNGNDLRGNRYEKTKEWLKNRGRSQSELILE